MSEALILNMEYGVQIILWKNCFQTIVVDKGDSPPLLPIRGSQINSGHVHRGLDLYDTSIIGIIKLINLMWAPILNVG